MIVDNINGYTSNHAVSVNGFWNNKWWRNIYLNVIIFFIDDKQTE